MGYGNSQERRVFDFNCVLVLEERFEIIFDNIEPRIETVQPNENLTQIFFHRSITQRCVRDISITV